MARVIVPVTLQKFTEGHGNYSSQDRDLLSCFSGFVARYPLVKAQLFDGEGKLHRFVNVFVDQQDIRALDGVATKLNDDSEVLIVPAMAGG